MLVIEVDRCSGCGACVQACSRRAISLVKGVAQIESALCTECQACVEACPTGAIRVATPIARKHVEQAEVVLRQEQGAVATVVGGSLTALAATSLTFVGRYLLPRAVEALVRLLEQRLDRGSGSTPLAPSASRCTAAAAPNNRASGRRQRHRGGP